MTDLLSASQAAIELGISRTMLHNLLHAGKLKAQRIGQAWVVERHDLEALKAEREARKNRRT